MKRPAAASKKTPATASKKPAASRSRVTKRPASVEPAARGMPSEFGELVAQHVLESMYKQLHLADVVEERSWSLCLDPAKAEYGKLCFGQDQELAFECQLLGSESYESGTWLWAWANESVPKEMACDLRKASGRPIREFGEAQFPLSTASGHQIAVAACGLMGAKAYYSGPTGPSGRLFVLITDASFPACSLRGPEDIARLLRCIGQGLELGWVPACRTATAVEDFLKNHGGKLLENGNYELAHASGTMQIELEINDDRSLKSIGTVSGA
eukprot:TRINITY_DN66029_c0_g1_i1.p1 TRINITY_DN66029_c0_g1~~TRINITY_DN66029_c0_g1_i1.p1  ORF type:complete len:270 (+),score=44.12 TRINITY_DN66029_c0_g1_i1:42-851(+)